MINTPPAGWAMVICNPVSGSGRSPEGLRVLEAAFRRAGARYAAEITRRPGDATRLARQAVAEGCSTIVVIGGDGTFFEAVNGIMPTFPPAGGSVSPPPVALGLLQAGRGSDFGRSVGIPSDWGPACARLLGGRTILIDLGHVTYRVPGGATRSRYFANAAGLGFDAAVTLRANRAPRALGGAIPYLSSLFFTLLTYRNKRLLVQTDNRPFYRARANSVVVANGQYFGGGMRIAPDARLTDGLLDTLVLGDLSKADLVRNVPSVYSGTHITHPKISIRRARNIEVTSPDRPLLQADGEMLGAAPANFTVVPAALRLLV